MAESTRPPHDGAFRVLPTEYAGFTFRSRTEARWAVFFDALNLKWDYEREGFEFNGQRYLPDFWLAELDRWLEVKGTVPTRDEKEKAQWLADGTGYYVLLAFGEPSLPQHGWNESMWILGTDDEGGLWDSGYWWCECPYCGFIDAEFMGRAARLRCRCIVSRYPDEDKAYNFDSERLTSAYTAARTAFTGPTFRGGRG